MNSFACNLPLPPSVNAAYRNVQGVGRVKTGPYKSWRAAAALVVKQAWKAQGKPTFAPHLGLTIHLGLNYQSDIDNRVKAICDVLGEGIEGFPNDRWIDRIEVERVPMLSGANIYIQQLAPPAKRTGEAEPFGIVAARVVHDLANRMEASK